jgi:hypothetical protein
MALKKAGSLGHSINLYPEVGGNSTRLIYFLQTESTCFHPLPYYRYVASKQLLQIEREKAKRLKEGVNLNSALLFFS